MNPSSHLWCDHTFTTTKFPVSLSHKLPGTSRALTPGMTNLKLAANDSTDSPTPRRARYTPLRLGARPALQGPVQTAPVAVPAAPMFARWETTPAPVELPTTRLFSGWRAFGGAIVGASVPASVFTVSHTTVPAWEFTSVVLWIAVVGGLVFSAQSVYQYGCKLFRDRVSGNTRRLKAACYCALAETIMTFAPSFLLPLSLAMLAILVAVNAIENGRNAGS